MEDVEDMCLESVCRIFIEYMHTCMLIAAFYNSSYFVHFIHDVFVLKVHVKKELLREVNGKIKDSYKVVVIATDKGSPPLSSSAEVSRSNKINVESVTRFRIYNLEIHTLTTVHNPSKLVRPDTSITWIGRKIV